MRYLGGIIYKGQLRKQTRTQSLATFFYRSLRQMRSLEGPLQHLVQGSEVRILITGCSVGCEVYSLAGYLETMFPELSWHITAIDISDEAVARTKTGIYSDKHGLGLLEIDIVRHIEGSLFERSGGEWRVKDAVRSRVTVNQADVLSPKFIETYTGYDVVFGQNYLIHMPDNLASQAFDSLIHALRQGGALFITGMDLDLRAQLSGKYGLKPVDFDLCQIHEDDLDKRIWWPWKYWSLEPFDPQRPDYLSRYATLYIK